MTNGGGVPGPPDDLEESGRALWTEIHSGWELGPHESRLLLEACRLADELDMIRQAIREGPATVEGSKGQPRPSPLWEEARRHREQLSRLITALSFPADSGAESAPMTPAQLKAQRAGQARWNAERARRESQQRARRRNA